MLFVNLLLLCGDVLQNPGPKRIQCLNCHKTIRKNQGRADCSDCLQSYHLKCLGADFETSKKRSLCSVREMDTGNESGDDCIDFNIAAELREATKLRGLKFIHQNIRSIREKLDELNILVSQCPNLHILAFTETWLIITTLQTVKCLYLNIRFSEAIDQTVKLVGLQCTSKNLFP